MQNCVHESVLLVLFLLGQKQACKDEGTASDEVWHRMQAKNIKEHRRICVQGHQSVHNMLDNLLTLVQALHQADLATVMPLSKVKGGCFPSFAAASVALNAAS